MDHPVFTSDNRITPDRFFAKRGTKHDMCRGAWGMQSDCQCLGYDSLCGLAIMLYGDDEHDRDKSSWAVYNAQEEARVSPYSKGFHHGWDGHTKTQDDAEYLLGYEDGNAIASKIPWRLSRPSDCSVR